MKKVLTMLLALAACAALILTRQGEKQYRTEAVAVREVSEKIEAVGTVGYEQLYALTPGATGTVERLFVQQGQHVRKGQAVAELCLLPDAAGAYLAAARELDDVQLSEAMLELATVRAPADGTVVEWSGYEGMAVAPTIPLGAVASEELRVTALVPESVREELYEGQQAVVRRGSAKCDATVERICASTEAASQYVLTLCVQDAQQALCAGMRVDVSILLRSCSAPAVPLQAVRGDGTVLCATGEGVTPVKVEVGLCSESYAQLVSGPPVGTSVVVGEE